MTTRMLHPEHGATHAYSEGEIQKLKASGWIVEGEQDEPAPVVEPAVEKRKPGRPRKAS